MECRMGVNRKRRSVVVPAAFSFERYQDVKVFNLLLASERLLGAVTSFFDRRGLDRKGGTVSRFDTLLCTDRDPLAFSLIRPCGDENLVSTTPGRKEARTPPKSPPPFNT